MKNFKNLPKNKIIILTKPRESLLITIIINPHLPTIINRAILPSLNLNPNLNTPPTKTLTIPIKERYFSLKALIFKINITSSTPLQIITTSIITSRNQLQLNSPLGGLKQIATVIAKTLNPSKNLQSVSKRLHTPLKYNKLTMAIVDNLVMAVVIITPQPHINSSRIVI